MVLLTPCVSAPLPPVRPAWPVTAPASLPERLLTACAVMVPAAAAAAMRAGKAPRTLRGRGALVAAWLLRAMVAYCVLRAARRMQWHERSLVNETAAAVPGSRFMSLGLPTPTAGAAPSVSLHFLSESIPGAPSPDGAPPRPPVLLHLNHGFGSNCLTWAPLLRSLAESHPRRARPAAAPSLRAVAHDRVGFGLTSRPRQAWSYGSAVAMRHAVALIAAQAAEAAAAAVPAPAAGAAAAAASNAPASAPTGTAPAPASTPAPAPASAVPTPVTSSRVALPEMILVGHSVGAILAARLALLSNETLGARVRGLVLIAPAAFLPRVKGKKAGWKGGKGKGVADGKGVEGEGGGEMYGRGGGWESGNDGGVADWEGGGGVSEEGEERTAVTAGRAAGGAVAVGYSETGYSEVDPTAPSPPSFARRPRRALSRLASSVTARLLRLFLFLPLRLAVRAIIGSEAFWRRGLGNAYRDTFRLTDDMLRRYRWPSAVRGADRGVAQYILAQLGAAQRPKDAEPDMTDGQVWAAICSPDFRIPTLVLHGTSDALVPISVSRQLCSRMEGASLVELPSGHVPHEEDPDRVAAEISAFIARHAQPAD